MRECSVAANKGKMCLPDIIPCQNLLDWNGYLENLYDTVFVPDFLNSCPKFKGLRVFIRKEPRDGRWEHGFTHMTHEDYRHTSRDPNDRVPDLRRTERLNWVRKIIERYPCAVENSCGEIWYWEEMFRGRVRCNLLYASEKFLIVLEKAKDVYFIITSFYLDTDWAFEKRRRKYEKYKQQKTPLA